MITRIIGFSGKMGSGKDTAANMFQAIAMHYILEGTTDKNTLDISTLLKHREAFIGSDIWAIKKFADKLKKICSLITGVPVSNFESQDFKKQDMSRQWNIPVGLFPGDEKTMTYRELLQRVGTDGMRDNVHPNIWVNALFADYTPTTDPTIKEYNEEYPKWLITDVRFPNEVEAITERGGVVIRINRKAAEVGDNHVSETMLDNHKFDYVINNNGTLDDLAIELINIYNSLS